MFGRFVVYLGTGATWVAYVYIYIYMYIIDRDPFIIYIGDYGLHACCRRYNMCLYVLCKLLGVLF